MKLISEWRLVLRKAWSVRLMAGAVLMSGAEVVVPLFSDLMPRGVFASLSFFTVTGALIMRHVAQKGMNGDE